MSAELAGQAAVVTGAGTGIGYAIAEALARAGALVTLNDRDAGLAEAAAGRINAEVGAALAHAHPGDIADVAATRALVARAAALAPLRVCVANAGVTRFEPFLEAEPGPFDQLLAVNLRGSYFTAQAAARAMVAHGGGGRIVLLASVTGLRAIRGLSAYGVTKAGIMAMARSLAAELGSYGITVNAVAPGATITERTLAETPDYAADWGAVAATGRASQVSDIAAAVRFLASPAAAQVTGQTLVVDGGWTLASPVPPGY